MNPDQASQIESKDLGEFARVMRSGTSWTSAHSNETSPNGARRINLDPESVKNGLGRLVLTLIKLLHELLERQALRRMESGVLSESEIERLGITLMRQAQELEKLRETFGLEEADLNIDLGPLGKLL